MRHFNRAAHLYMSACWALQAGRRVVSASMRTRHASTSLYADSSPAEMDASVAGTSTRPTSCMHDTPLALSSLTACQA